MSSKQKIALSVVGVVLVLAIIGLTIGLVLVASQANVTNSMKVTYSAANVECTITASAQSQKADGSKIDDVEVTAGATTSFTTEDRTGDAAKSITFADATIGDDGNGKIVYTFSIKNDAPNNATPARKHIKAVAAIADAEDNMKVEISNTGAASIEPQGTGTITVTVTVEDPSLNATFDSGNALTITITEVQ